jgi:hypothetical protein
MPVTQINATDSNTVWVLMAALATAIVYKSAEMP